MTAARCFTRVHSPVGPLLLVGTQTSLTGLYMQNSSHNVTPEPAWTEDSRPFAAVRGQLEAYFAGSLTEFDLKPRAGGHAIPANGVERTAIDPVRHHHDLRSVG